MYDIYDKNEIRNYVENKFIKKEQEINKDMKKED